GTKEVLTQTGNINGLAGYSTEIYGFYATDTVFIGDRNDNFMEYANGSMNVKADDFNLNANSSQLLINSGPPTIMTRDNSTGDRVYFGKTYSPSLSQYGSLGINMINENSGREFFRLDSSERHISHWDIGENAITKFGSGRMFIMSNTKEFSASYKGGAGIV